MERDRKTERRKQDEVQSYSKELTSFFWTAKVEIESKAKVCLCPSLHHFGINISTSMCQVK